MWKYEGMAPSAVNATAGTVLGFLSRGRMSGWDLSRAIADSVGNFWNVTRSQVYRELQSLETRGLVVPVGERGARDRRVYRLTPAGRREFKRWVARDPEDETRRVPVLLTTYFGDEVPAKRLAAILAAHRDELTDQLARYRAMERESAGDPYARAAARYGVAYCRMALRWIDTESAALTR
jgi:DNA-binding PadR family transcriptional regulator